MGERRFGPSQKGETGLAVVLFCAAGFFLYFFWLKSPYFPEFGKSAQFASLAAGVCLVTALGALRWKRFQAEIVLSGEGIVFEASGSAPVARTALAWKDIAGLELLVETRPRDGNLQFLVFIAGPGAAKPGRRYVVSVEGLDERLSVIVDAIACCAMEHGFVLKGPRPQHVAAWFNGMNWTLEPADKAERAATPETGRAVGS